MPKQGQSVSLSQLESEMKNDFALICFNGAVQTKTAGHLRVFMLLI